MAAAARPLSANSDHTVELDDGTVVEIPPHARNRADPTGTKPGRGRYLAQLNKRYRALRGAIRRVVVDDDFLRFKGGTPPGGQGDVRGFAQNAPFSAPGGIPDPTDAPKIPRPADPTYSFPRGASRRQQFVRWVEQSGNLVTLGNPTGLPGDSAWTDEYVRYAYNKGIMHADASLRFYGVDVPQEDIMNVFNLPVHRDTLQFFHDRQYDKLRGLNRAMSDRIGETLSQAFAEGLGTHETAGRLTNDVRALQAKRAAAIARTEMIWASNEATLNRLGQVMGETADLTVVAEFSTAGDRRVCSQCQALEGERFRLADAHNVIPAHPMCRCVWIPVTDYGSTQTQLGA